MKRFLISSTAAFSILSCSAQNNDFTSPDLDLFNVHGPVKELTISYQDLDDDDDLFEGLYQPGIYKFDSQGKWTNPQAYKIERNDRGQIVKFVLSDEEEYADDWHFWEEFEWKNNYLSHHSLYPNEVSIHYLDNNISLIEVTHGYTQYPMEDIIRLSDFEYDERGNWISCNWRQTISYDTSDYPSVPAISPIYSSGTIKRKITYY